MSPAISLPLPRVRRLLTAGSALAAAMLMLLLGPPDAASVASCTKVRVNKLKVKKVRPSDPVSCHDARRVASRWVRYGYDDFNPIRQGENRWHCSWRRRAPGSRTTGTAECDANPGEAVGFAVRKRK